MKETVSFGPRNTRAGYNGRRKRCGSSQSGESTNTVSKYIVAQYCSVIITASFSGFIIQLLMVINIGHVVFLFVY